MASSQETKNARRQDDENQHLKNTSPGSRVRARSTRSSRLMRNIVLSAADTAVARETDMLRKTVKELHNENNALKREIAELKQQLESYANEDEKEELPTLSAGGDNTASMTAASLLQSLPEQVLPLSNPYTGSTQQQSTQSDTRIRKTSSQKRTLFEKWMRALRHQSAKTKLMNTFGVCPFYVTIKDIGSWTSWDFEDVFGNSWRSGSTALNVQEFSSYEEIRLLFAKEGNVAIPPNGFQVQNWYEGHSNQSYRSDDLAAELHALKIIHNRTKQTLEFEFLLYTTENAFMR